MTEPGWAGGYVSRNLGIDVTTDPETSLIPVEDLVGLAVRRNPRRAHLLVSTVLGKHLPADPSLIFAAGELLGALVSECLSETAEECRQTIVGAARELSAALRQRVEDPRRTALLEGTRRRVAALKTRHPEVVTIGYAETATGLGRIVADSIGSYYIHSTRHACDGMTPFGSFEEEHSHATSHRLLPSDPRLLRGSAPLVLVDDELSTGATIVNTIRELNRLAPRAEYIVATLIDLRPPGDRLRLDQLAEELDARIRVVALARGGIDLPDDVLNRADEMIASLALPVETSEARSGRISFLHVESAEARTGITDRFGNNASTSEAVVQGLVERVAARLTDSTPVTVLGTEEFMYFPLALAERLGRGRPPGSVRFSTTTRSPIVALDRPDYAVRSGLAFRSHDDTLDGPGPRYVYNLDGDRSGSSTVVVVPEPGTSVGALTGRDGLLAALRTVYDNVVAVLISSKSPTDARTPPRVRSSGSLPAPLFGPEFGSYARADVTWLLKDLSNVALEASTAEREAAVQSGGAHYAESLPIEYTPSARYQSLYREALTRSAPRVAEAVGIVAEAAFAMRSQSPVLVSLARAGTPVGILMKRWIRKFHRVEVPHYTISIVRGKGVDTTALRYLTEHHDPEHVVFVDGWTGKGAISKELQAAVENFNKSHGTKFRPELAVLADPGNCASLFGTRDDFLIPSSCLNATVSGLVSRTVLNAKHVGPDDFHGAKFYRELGNGDVSNEFLKVVEEHFEGVRNTARGVAAALIAEDPVPSWAGWTAVEEIGHELGIDNLNLIKPGVGETTRVLLRRVPWKVLVRPNAGSDVEHVLLLAQQRGVAVQIVEGLSYSCVGVIHPLETPGATGWNGTSAMAGK